MRLKIKSGCWLLISRLLEAQLQLGFYSESCPKAEKIVQDFVNKHIHNAPSLAAALIRMHFHDCFVEGCDASILLNSTSEGNTTEKTALPNLSVRGFDFIDRIKSLIEAECPQTVSCADIIALTARDSIVATGGPTWKVPTGRRDGTISRVNEANSLIPAPFDGLANLTQRFSNLGLDLKDLVLLSGAHTIGIAHCATFADRRLLNFSGVLGAVDPTMDPAYAANLKANKCKKFNDAVTIVEMDPGSRKTFDLSYYSHLLKRRGLFESDQALTNSSASLAVVNQLLQGSLANFFGEFGLSMEKMGRIGVKTGTTGEIRKNCALVN